MNQFVQSTQSQLDSTKKSIQNIYEELNHLRIKHATLKNGLENAEKFQSSLTKRIQEINARKQESSKNKLSFLETEEKLSKEKDHLSEWIDNKEMEIETMEEALDEAKIIYSQNKDDFLKKQLELKNQEQRIKNLKNQLQDHETLLTKIQVRLQESREKAITLKTDIDQLNVDSVDLTQNIYKLSESLQEKKKILTMKKSELEDLIKATSEREKELVKIQSKLNHWEKELALSQLKKEKIIDDEEICVRDIVEKYFINIRLGVGEYLHFTDELWGLLKPVEKLAEAETKIFHKKTPKEVHETEFKLKKAKQDFQDLGEINWSALKEYERQKKRYEFLDNQEKELKKSLEDLQKAIMHIDEKSIRKFKEAFHDVNERFSKVFPLLFGGGDAKLQIIGNLDDAECGIDINVRPPGKKMQNINLLSGGEKALTAMGLIFSIFLVKPSPFCLLDEVDAPLDDANVGRFNNLLREMGVHSQFILITHNKKTMELNDVLYGITMQEPGVSKAVSVQLH